MSATWCAPQIAACRQSTVGVYVCLHGGADAAGAYLLPNDVDVERFALREPRGLLPDEAREQAFVDVGRQRQGRGEAQGGIAADRVGFSDCSAVGSATAGDATAGDATAGDAGAAWAAGGGAAIGGGAAACAGDAGLASC